MLGTERISVYVEAEISAKTVEVFISVRMGDLKVKTGVGEEIKAF